MESVYLPIAPDDAKELIADLSSLSEGLELIPIPAMGGCVVAVKESLPDANGLIRLVHEVGRKERVQRVLSALESHLLPDDAA